ncbi:sigma-70 family RNA polymerase sigma factor [Clostridium autoethanogenum]|uniref:Sigma-70 family RNA polymerase sigma factor n=1 Tax=Clostridium autoethanogenum TaxID=84023 RepID=A0A3M0SQI5_9CLOT|nr:sigma-70 family RNA polymerase sigma factor [Clostridium autoethanogenum]RMC99950.1 sigma-70 family RNA polymerase sigma factor [Clostridium autoethanogenum]
MILEEQVKLAINQDEKAFEYLMNISKEGLYRIAFAYAKNEQDALDILQETVYKAYISIYKLKKPKYFKTWISKILINNAIDFINKKKKINYLPDSLSDESHYYKENHIEEKLDILNYIDKLEDKYKNIIFLKYFQDLTIAEISQVMDCPIGTVKTHLNKALSSLRIFMGKDIC